MSLMGENIVVKEFKHLRGDVLGSLIHLWLVYLMVPVFHMLDVVYVRGGCIDLVGCPSWGKIEWLKSLNISEGMFRIFNSCMVFVLDGAHVYTLHVVYVHGRGLH